MINVAARVSGLPMSGPGRASTMRRKFDYCLYCYAPLGGAEECPDCGVPHVVVDARAYWSREPRLRALEGALKAVLYVALVFAFVKLAIVVGSESGDPRVAAFLVGPILILGIALHWTAGLITRRAGYVSPKLVWGLVVGLFVFAGPLLLVLLDFLARRDVTGGEYWGKFVDIFVRGLPVLLLGGVLYLAGLGLEAYKRRVLPGAADSASSGGA